MLGVTENVAHWLCLSGHWLSDCGWVKPNSRCSLSSSTRSGVPNFCRYSGAASTFNPGRPIGRACRLESCRVPMRIATSVRCSSKSIIWSLVFNSKSISGNCAVNSSIRGTTTCSINGDAAFMRRRPAGRCRCKANCSSASSIASRIARARSRKIRPSSVKSMRRVVRLSSVVSSFCSKRPSARLIPLGV